MQEGGRVSDSGLLPLGTTLAVINRKIINFFTKTSFFKPYGVKTINCLTPLYE